jgi:segregation and condensation protein B
MSDAAPATISFQKLASAFARMFGGAPAEEAAAPMIPQGPTPQSIVEGRLFIGAPAGGFMTAAQLCHGVRDVAENEIDALVQELSQRYERDAAPYTIESTAEGYRLTLRPEFQRLRDKFYGRVRETTLSPLQLEVLSVVAYRQPISLGEIDLLRGVSSSGQVAQLVRRGLAKLERSDAGARYVTTPKFLKLFHLQEIKQLPMVAEVAD